MAPRAAPVDARAAHVGVGRGPARAPVQLAWVAVRCRNCREVAGRIKRDDNAVPPLWHCSVQTRDGMWRTSGEGTTHRRTRVVGEDDVWVREWIHANRMCCY